MTQYKFAFTTTKYGVVPVAISDFELEGAYVFPTRHGGSGMVSYVVKVPQKNGRDARVADCSRPEFAELIVKALKQWATAHTKENADVKTDDPIIDPDAAEWADGANSI